MATVTLHEAAEQLGVHYMTVYRYVRTGRLEARQTGGIWQVEQEHLDLVQVGRRKSPARSGAVTARPEALLGRLVAGDDNGAWRIVEDALTAGADPADIHRGWLIPAMTRMGELWARGEMTVADEHIASAVATRLVGRLHPMFRPPGRRAGRVVLGAVSGDHHLLPSLMFADLLTAAGADVCLLGANTPAESFLEMLRQPTRCVALTVTAPDVEIQVEQTVAAIRAAHPAVAILIGGSAVAEPGAAVRLGSDGHAADLDDALRLVLATTA